MAKGKPVPKTHREKSPCYECAERFIACSDRCPKDERGEFGYKAWKAKIACIDKARKDYLRKNGYKYYREEKDDG